MARHSASAALAIAGAALFVAVLTGCTGTPSPEPTPSPSTSRPQPSGEATAEPVGLHPDLPAADNLPYFDQVNQKVVAANGAAAGRDFIDALVAAGFDKAAMQVTSDQTSLGEPADSVQFAVAFNDECLVGQYGPKSGGYHGVVQPALGTGGCLVGQTRPIDW
ncbi:hypothetical protein SAMN05428970_2043 [Agromyces sp. CF514]|uniref:DUF6993 domain-containing protein n=1 Tax=Agromyces sp. CF514 TaxID=1881031 RepID=UPI0008ED0C53|nr:hypothetical protein [Agromyces sp. CF514]SFR76284.1 hypothetical protein SAMN05428970_2043 [Agromyces sp. CF514]